MKKIIVLSLILLSNSIFAWDILRNQKGSLTGYSTPISQDIFKQLNIDLDNKQNLKSPNNMTDLYSMPQTNYNYSKSNSLKSITGGGVGTKTGVTIIYD